MYFVMNIPLLAHGDYLACLQWDVGLWSKSVIFVFHCIPCDAFEDWTMFGQIVVGQTSHCLSNGGEIHIEAGILIYNVLISWALTQNIPRSWLLLHKIDKNAWQNALVQKMLDVLAGGSRVWVILLLCEHYEYVDVHAPRSVYGYIMWEVHEMIFVIGSLCLKRLPRCDQSLLGIELP